MRSSKSRSRSKANRPRTLGNIINRVFDSSGPEGKVRGTPQQIIEKYLILARDAQLSNDRVAAENFLQHAEHYTRLLGEAQREMAAEQDGRRFDGGGQPRQDGNGWGQQGGYGGNGQPRDFRDDPRDEQPRRDDRGEFREARRDDRDQPRQDNRDQPRQDNRDQQRQDNRDQPRRDDRDQRPDNRDQRQDTRRDDNRGDRRPDQPRGDQPRQDNREPRQDNRDRRDQRPDFRNDRRDGNRPDQRDQPRRDAPVVQGPAAVIDLGGDEDTGLVETPEAMAPAVVVPVVAVPAAAPAPAMEPAAAPAAEPSAATVVSGGPVAEAAAPKPARKPRAPRKPKEAPTTDGGEPKEAAE